MLDIYGTEVNNFFNWCVLVLEIMADLTGMSYELINILIFVILHNFNL